MYLTSLGEAFVGLSSLADLASRARLFSPNAVEPWRCLLVLGISFRLHMRRASAVCSPGPGARANVCDSDASTFPSSPQSISICKTHGARG
jgi:hypothetical protein